VTKSLVRPAAVVLTILVVCVVAWIALVDGCSTRDDVVAPPRVVADEVPAAAPAPAAAPPVEPPPRQTAPPAPARRPHVEPPPAPKVETPAPEPVVEEGVVVAGRVVDAAGAPIAGASVVATTFRPLAERGAKPPLRGAAKSGADGTFRTRLPKGTALVDVFASAAGFASASVDRVRVGSPVDVRLEREGVLAGRVVDPDGKAIPGAAVRLFRVLGYEHVDTAAATTSADGEFRIGGFATAPWKNPFKEPWSIVLDVRASGFAASQDYGPFPTKAGATKVRDVVLYPARPLPVAVRDADTGAPLAGAWVGVGFHARGLEVRGAGEEPSFVPDPAPYVDEGTTDDRGLCVLANSPARLVPPYQRLIVRAWKKGFTAEVSVVTQRPRVADERVDLGLWPSATVTGRVVDSNGAPVAGATVRADALDKLWDISFAAPVGDRPWGGTYRTTGVATDDAGRYVLPCIRAGRGAVTAFVWTMGRRDPLPDGTFFPMPYWGAGGRPPGADVRVRAGEEATAPDIVLPGPKPTRAARFLVVDESDAPVADARLENACASPLWTDAEGRATLRWSAEAEWWQSKLEDEPVVAVAAAGFVAAAVRCRPDARFPPEVRVVLAHGTRLEGRVHEEDGRPAVGWTVTAWRSTGDHVTYGGAQTDADGRFEIDDVPAGTVDLEVGHIGDSEMNRMMELTGIASGGAPVDVVLRPETTRFGSVLVEIVDAADGSPIVESYATVDCGPGAYPRSTLVRPGTQMLERVPVGTRTVRAQAKGWHREETTVTVEEGQTTDVRIALTAGTPAVVRLVAPVPLRYSNLPAFVWAARADLAPGELGAGFEVSSNDFDADGVTIRFDALPAGRYRIGCAVSRPGGDSVAYVSTQALNVGPPGKATARATLQLVVAGTLSVGARDPEVPKSWQNPPVLSKAAVEVLAPGGERVRVMTGVTDSGTSMPLPPGAYVVRLVLPSGRVREAQATVRAGQTTSVNLGSQ
jgi:protocatechuate 3,4-dioxygenase beta subunit